MARNLKLLCLAMLELAGHYLLQVEIGTLI
jgi:hypothetical protein